jgi:hypothetical protein
MNVPAYSMFLDIRLTPLLFKKAFKEKDLPQQITVIDVTDWLVDDMHGIFPIGARDKQM